MRVLVAFYCLLLVGCATAETITLPRVPQWRAPSDPRTYTAAEVVQQCGGILPGVTVDTSDVTFTAVNHLWLTEAAEWSWQFSKGIGLVYTAESFDCDKFAAGFALAANVAAARAGVRAQPLLARIYVRQLASFGGVPAGGGHALNVVLTDRGLYVIEPQSRVIVPLAEYPNRAAIFRVKIGG